MRGFRLNAAWVFDIAVRGVLLAALGGLTVQANASIKCWINKDNVHECGNAVPPEYAQEEHEVKSANGITIKTQGRAKTRDEIAQQRAEQDRAARKKAAADAIARKQAAADKVLLDTFGSEDDMVLARDGQLANLDSQIKLTKSQIEKVEKSLDQLISKAADFEKRNQKVPPNLLKDIARLQGQIAEQKGFIEAKLSDQTKLRKKFELDIARFRELRGARR